jgi:hypothetical protein
VDRPIDCDRHANFGRFAVHQNAAQRRNKRSRHPIHWDVTGHLDHDLAALTVTISISQMPRERLYDARGYWQIDLGEMSGEKVDARLVVANF